jgi:nitroreductase
LCLRAFLKEFSEINMDAITALKERRSVRSYRQQSVDREIIEDIIDCARLAPTAMNDQPWDFVVLTRNEDLQRIPPMLGHGEFIANAAFAVLVLAHGTNYAVEDCSAATENLLIAATANGLGSCWVAGTKQAYGPVVVKAFGAPEDRELIAIVSFGYPAEEPKVEKRPLSEVLHWDRF